MSALAPFLMFCAGCALIQLGHLHFPPPQKVVGPARVSMLELTRPRLFFWLFVAVKAGALASVVAEAWLGVRLYSWWPGLVLFIPVTVLVDLLAPRMAAPKAVMLGMTLVAFSSVVMILV